EEAAAQPRRAKHADAPQPAAHKPRTAAGGNGGSRKPPRDEDDAPRKAKGGKSGKKGGSGKGGNGKKKKKIRWWQILLITLLVIALIFGGAFALIMGAITPAGGNIKLNQLINTPKEFQGKEFNILVTGVDRSSTGDLSAGAANDSNVNDGMTDMILYVHFNNETGEMKMLQIPRDTMVTTDTSVSGNFRINGVAKTQGSDSNNNMAALCELVADQYKLPIDGFITIRLEMLTELVDLFGGVEINVPVDVDYAALGLGDSVIHAGYQTLNGASMEFLLRARKIYPDGDIGRLNMQRQFYAALFRKLKSIGNIWDVAKLTPAVLNYMETNLSASDLISFAISMLKIDSSKIMICQMPVISGPQYNGQSLLYPARQADADLLNQYFRENTGPVDASQLNLCDNVIDLSGYTATDPNIQQMGGLMAAADDAQKDPNQNLDGSNQVTDIMASESTAESESTDTDSTDTESQPAA
uniref:LCP family protein n=1 Tax=Gemmiger formicilis TaxID=745368 RepID=UPI004029BB4F